MSDKNDMQYVNYILGADLKNRNVWTIALIVLIGITLILMIISLTFLCMKRKEIVKP